MLHTVRGRISKTLFNPLLCSCCVCNNMIWVVEFLGGKEKLARFMQENKQNITLTIFTQWLAQS